MAANTNQQQFARLPAPSMELQPLVSDLYNKLATVQAQLTTTTDQLSSLETRVKKLEHP